MTHRQNFEIGDAINSQIFSSTKTLSSTQVADWAVAALRAEADLTPKPGLVDRRGRGAHTDMNRDMLYASGDSLWPAFEQCFSAATASQPTSPQSDVALREALGVIGRTGERAMLAATGGVNTHRGALWALGLLSAAAATSTDIPTMVARAAQLARIPDPALRLKQTNTSSHGGVVRLRYGVHGARGEAREGFPHIVRYALPALAEARSRGADEPTARLQALLALMAQLDDTCILHRGGMPALRWVQSAAAAVLDAGGPQTSSGRRQFSRLDQLCSAQGWSPGGSGDLLAAALFLEAVTEGTDRQCKH